MHLTNLNLQHLNESALKAEGLFKDYTIPTDLFALNALRICFTRYIEDIKKCIKEGVLNDIRALGQDYESERKRSLNRWLATAGPSSFSFSSPHIGDLIVAVCGYEASSISHGLPPTSNVQLSTHQLASTIFGCASPLSSTSLRAPFISKGTFANFLKPTLKHLYDANVERLGQRTQDWLIEQIRRVLVVFNIKILPWSPAGTRQRLACWDQWAFVNVQSKALPIRTSSSSSSRSEIQNAISALVYNQLQSDPTMPWSLNEVQINDLSSIMDRGTLPNWEFPSQTIAKDEDSYVYKTYQWARETFDIEKPTHYIALAGAVTFAKLCPYVGHDKDQLSKFLNESSSKEQVRTKSSELSWVKSQKLEDRDSGKLACAFLTTAMALMDPESPLSKYMADNKGSLGKEWSNRNGE